MSWCLGCKRISLGLFRRVSESGFFISENKLAPSACRHLVLSVKTRFKKKKKFSMTNGLQCEQVAMSTSGKRSRFLSVFYSSGFDQCCKALATEPRSGCPGPASSTSAPRPWGRRMPQQDALLCSEGRSSRQLHEPGICLHSPCENRPITREVDGCRKLLAEPKSLLGNTSHKIQRRQETSACLRDSAPSWERSGRGAGC